MNNFKEKLQSIWKKLDNVFKFLLASILLSLYFELLITKAPNSLAKPTTVLFVFIAILYTFWQSLQGYWQIQDIRFNYLMLKHLQHPLSAKRTLLRTLYLAIISDLDLLSEEYENKLLTEKAEDEADLEKAEEQLYQVLAYQQRLLSAYTSNIKTWTKMQTFCKSRLQRAIDLDISFTKTDAQIIGGLGKRIIQQRKKLISLQKKTKWPKPEYYKFIYCLYHVIPHEVTGTELMRQSVERLHSEAFWSEYIDESLPKEIIQELGKFLHLIDQARAKIKK